jgi:GDSL-like lipase/acylhydrolase family protein
MASKPLHLNILRRPSPEALLALAAVAAVAFGLVGLELLLRLLDPRYLDRQGPTVYSETYGWAPRPGFAWLLHDIPTHVNAKSYRGPEHTLAKPPGRTRVVVLGDSIAFGARATDDQTFSALLQSRGERYDVVNLAVEGYGTDQELLRLEHEGLAYHPDVVILSFCLTNDVLNNSLHADSEDARVPKPYFTWDEGTLVLHDEHVKLSKLRRMAQWLEDESQVFRRAAALLPARTAEAESHPETAVRLKRLPAEDLTFRLIRRIHEVTLEAKARFLVVLHPDEPAYRRRSPLLQSFCWTPLLEGIPVVDLGDRYRAEGAKFDDIAVDYQGHLTPLGHRLTALEIEALLSETPPRPHRVACRDD